MSSALKFKKQYFAKCSCEEVIRMKEEGKKSNRNGKELEFGEHIKYQRK